MTLPTFITPEFSVSRKRLAFLCVVVSVAALVAFFVWAGKRELLALSGQGNQQFTELYVLRSSDIPTRLVAGQEYNVPFAIVNHERGTRTYEYQILISQNGYTERRPVGHATIHDGQRTIRDLRFTSATDTPLVVSVELRQPKQTIRFRVEP